MGVCSFYSQKNLPGGVDSCLPHVTMKCSCFVVRVCIIIHFYTTVKDWRFTSAVVEVVRASGGTAGACEGGMYRLTAL